MSRTSKLISDLTKVPNIIGNLGLSIAQAQKAFNSDYMDNVERLLAMTKMLLGAVPPENQEQLDRFRSILQDLLKALAPSRYQYTETTLAVRLDLAQTMDLNAQAGLGVGIGGIAINAAFAIGYGYDYRGAAECRTVIHAIPADNTVFNTLLERAKDLNDKTLELPERSEVDQRIIDAAGKIFEKLIETKPEPIKDESATT